MADPQRYDLMTNYRCGSSIEEMERADDGEWIRYEDVDLRVNELESALALETQRRQEAEQARDVNLREIKRLHDISALGANAGNAALCFRALFKIQESVPEAVICSGLEHAVRVVLDKLAAADKARAEAERAFNICADHQPDRWTGDGTCVICEGQRLHAQLAEAEQRVKALEIAASRAMSEHYDADRALTGCAQRVQALTAKWRVDVARWFDNARDGYHGEVSQAHYAAAAHDRKACADELEAALLLASEREP